MPPSATLSPAPDAANVAGAEQPERTQSEVSSNELEISDIFSPEEIQEFEKSPAEIQALKDASNYKNRNQKKFVQDMSYRTLWGTFLMPLKWRNIIMITTIHIIAVIGVCQFPFLSKKKTLAWGTLLGIMGGFGVTGGAHRFWTHRSYKANLPLRIILMICYAIAGQNKLLDWVRDHRVHHKFSETDADPHNSNRGFFFAHVGWLMMEKHPEVIRKGKLLKYDDLYEDEVFLFHEKFFWELKFLLTFVLPIIVPYYFWDETFGWCFVTAIGRLVLNLNFTWFVNSAAHIFGNRPYNVKITPVENLWVSFVALGEGWHNYHHAFPWDYKASELGRHKMNLTAILLDFFYKIGWAYEMKSVPKALVQKIALKHGDGSYLRWGEEEIPETEAKIE